MRTEERFAEEKIVSIWSDWCSTGIWDAHGGCVPVEWLPISDYAIALVRAMQILYDYQDLDGDAPFSVEHYTAYESARRTAMNQVRTELPDWEVR